MKEYIKKFDHGATVKDSITGFQGMITGHTNYITGCDQYLLQPTGNKDTKPEAIWFDENRLVAVKKKKFVLPEDGTERTGADLPAPVK